MAQQNRDLHQKATLLSGATANMLRSQDALLLKQRDKLRIWPQFKLKNSSQSLEHLKTKISLMDPARLLKKGYTLLKSEGHIVRDFDELGLEQEIEILTDKVNFKAKITEKNIHTDGKELNL